MPRRDLERVSVARGPAQRSRRGQGEHATDHHIAGTRLHYFTISLSRIETPVSFVSGASPKVEGPSAPVGWLAEWRSRIAACAPLKHSLPLSNTTVAWVSAGRAPAVGPRRLRARRHKSESTHGRDQRRLQVQFYRFTSIVREQPEAAP